MCGLKALCNLKTKAIFSLQKDPKIWTIHSLSTNKSIFHQNNLCALTILSNICIYLPQNNQRAILYTYIHPDEHHRLPYKISGVPPCATPPLAVALPHLYPVYPLHFLVTWHPHCIWAGDTSGPLNPGHFMSCPTDVWLLLCHPRNLEQLKSS